MSPNFLFLGEDGMLEIALGIVLAIIILYCLPLIIGVAVYAIGLLLLIAVIAGLYYNPETLNVLAGLVMTGVGFWAIAYMIDNIMPRRQVGGSRTFQFLLGRGSPILLARFALLKITPAITEAAKLEKIRCMKMVNKDISERIAAYQENQKIRAEMKAKKIEQKEKATNNKFLQINQTKQAGLFQGLKKIGAAYKSYPEFSFLYMKDSAKISIGKPNGKVSYNVRCRTEENPFILFHYWQVWSGAKTVYYFSKYVDEESEGEILPIMHSRSSRMCLNSVKKELRETFKQLDTA